MAQLSLSEFADKMNEVMPVIIKEFARRQADELYKGKITLPQFLILNFLNTQDESKMTDMARFMRVTTAAMTGVVDRLVKYGYALRGFDADDRRIIKIRLSQKGSELIRKINQQRRRMIMRIFGRISETERQGYLKILMRIDDILTKGVPE